VWESERKEKVWILGLLVKEKLERKKIELTCLVEAISLRELS